MRQPDIRIVPASAVRRALIGGNGSDIRAEVSFQNDINALMAQFEEARIPWRALAAPSPQQVQAAQAPARRSTIRIQPLAPVLRVFDGGGLAEGPALIQQTRSLPATDAVRVVVHAAAPAGSGRRARRA